MLLMCEGHFSLPSILFHISPILFLKGIDSASSHPYAPKQKVSIQRSKCKTSQAADGKEQSHYLFLGSEDENVKINPSDSTKREEEIEECKPGTSHAQTN